LQDLDASLFEDATAARAEVMVPASAMQGAHDALLSMGFTTQELELALRGADEAASESDLIKYALRRLGS
jgi:Holliday junction DNA helicase RuvA